MNRRAWTIPLMLIALAGCNGGHTDDKPERTTAQKTYDAGFTAAVDALSKGESISVMTGLEHAAHEQCAQIVTAFAEEKAVPPGYSAKQAENWFTGCEDAIQGNDRNNQHATEAPAGPA